MISRSYCNRVWITKEKNQLIEAICHNKSVQTPAFRDRLWLLIVATVPDEYIGAVYETMLSPNPLVNTAIKYSVSESTLSRLVKRVKENWDNAFTEKGWKFVPYEPDEAWKNIQTDF